MGWVVSRGNGKGVDGARATGGGREGNRDPEKSRGRTTGGDRGKGGRGEASSKRPVKKRRNKLQNWGGGGLMAIRGKHRDDTGVAQVGDAGGRGISGRAGMEERSVTWKGEGGVETGVKRLLGGPNEKFVGGPEGESFRE